MKLNRMIIAGVIALVCVFNPLFAKGTKDAESAKSANPVIETEKPDILCMSVLNGPSGIGMVPLFENAPDLDGVPSSFEVSASPQVLLPKLLKGEVDAGILPINLAAKVYTANKQAVVLAAITGNGMLSVISRDTSVKSLADLKGKKLTVAGQGGTPDYMIRYLARSEGIELNTEGGIEIDFSIPTPEIVPALLSGKIDYALVPEPFSTVAAIKDKSVVRVLDVQKLYEKACGIGGCEYPVMALVVRKAFAEQYPATLDLFLQACKKSVEAVNADPKAAGALVEKHTLGLKAPIVAASVPRSAFVWQTASESRESVERLLSVFAEFAPESIGGKLPDDGFYLK